MHTRGYCMSFCVSQFCCSVLCMFWHYWVGWWQVGWVENCIFSKALNNWHVLTLRLTHRSSSNLKSDDCNRFPSLRRKTSAPTANMWSHSRRAVEPVNSGSWLRPECRCCSSGDFLTTELHLSMKPRAQSASAGFPQWESRLHLPSDRLDRTLNSTNPCLPQVLPIALTGSSYKSRVCPAMQHQPEDFQFSFFL